MVNNTDTNTTMTLTANDTGYYEANLLLPGNYRVTAEMSGFKKSIRSRWEARSSTMRYLLIEGRVRF